ncbi:hypothetical protein JHK85_003464 [Glycine max]|nr:hypothetical protein JHK85_003464 [Glycine max]
MQFPNGKDDLMNFKVSIRPDKGYYKGGTFLFTFQVSPIYPHEAPKVKVQDKEPNYEDPLNHEAATVLRDNPKMFQSNVFFKKRGDVLAGGGGGGVEVGPREDLKEDVIAKDVSEGSGEEVIVDNEVSIGDNKNGKGRVVREIHDEGVIEARREMNWESFDMVERRAVLLE